MEVISEGQAANVFKPESAEIMAKTAWTMVHGVAHLAIDGQLDSERFGDCQVMLPLMGDHLIDGLKA
jgi:hypothetical protein